jgi:hypothetical protein
LPEKSPDRHETQHISPADKLDVILIQNKHLIVKLLQNHLNLSLLLNLDGDMKNAIEGVAKSSKNIVRPESPPESQIPKSIYASVLKNFHTFQNEDKGLDPDVVNHKIESRLAGVQRGFDIALIMEAYRHIHNRYLEDLSNPDTVTILKHKNQVTNFLRKHINLDLLTELDPDLQSACINIVKTSKDLQHRGQPSTG